MSCGFVRDAALKLDQSLVYDAHQAASSQGSQDPYPATNPRECHVGYGDALLGCKGTVTHDHHPVASESVASQRSSHFVARSAALFSPNTVTVLRITHLHRCFKKMASARCATTSLLIVMVAMIGATSAQATKGPTTATAKPSLPSFEQPVVTIAPFAPIGELKEYVCAFHLYAHTNARQMQAHHYCSVINGGKLHQCVLYDNSTAGARLMGIEYLIPMDVYAGLPTQEQQLWHSHEYEVRERPW